MSTSSLPTPVSSAAHLGGSQIQPDLISLARGWLPAGPAVAAALQLLSLERLLVARSKPTASPAASSSPFPGGPHQQPLPLYRLLDALNTAVSVSTWTLTCTSPLQQQGSAVGAGASAVGAGARTGAAAHPTGEARGMMVSMSFPAGFAAHIARLTSRLLGSDLVAADPQAAAFLRQQVIARCRVVATAVLRWLTRHAMRDIFHPRLVSLLSWFVDQSYDLSSLRRDACAVCGVSPAAAAVGRPAAVAASSPAAVGGETRVQAPPRRSHANDDDDDEDGGGEDEAEGTSAVMMGAAAVDGDTSLFFTLEWPTMDLPFAALASSAPSVEPSRPRLSGKRCRDGATGTATQDAASISEGAPDPPSGGGPQAASMLERRLRILQALAGSWEAPARRPAGHDAPLVAGALISMTRWRVRSLLGSHVAPPCPSDVVVASPMARLLLDLSVCDSLRAVIDDGHASRHHRLNDPLDGVSCTLNGLCGAALWTAAVRSATNGIVARGGTAVGGCLARTVLEALNSLRRCDLLRRGNHDVRVAVGEDGVCAESAGRSDPVPPLPFLVEGVLGTVPTLMEDDAAAAGCHADASDVSTAGIRNQRWCQSTGNALRFRNDEATSPLAHHPSAPSTAERTDPFADDAFLTAVGHLLTRNKSHTIARSTTVPPPLPPSEPHRLSFVRQFQAQLVTRSGDSAAKAPARPHRGKAAAAASSVPPAAAAMAIHGALSPLPDDVLPIVLAHLPPRHLRSAQSVCKRWARIIDGVPSLRWRCGLSWLVKRRWEWFLVDEWGEQFGVLPPLLAPLESAPL